MWQQLSIRKPKEQEINTINFNNRKLLLTTIKDKLFCADDVCPHEGIALSLGCIENNKIRCSLHSFSFDLTSGECDEKNIDKLNIYPVKEQDGKLWIKI